MAPFFVISGRCPQGRLKSMVQFVSQLMPSSADMACSHLGVAVCVFSQRNLTSMGRPSSVSFAMKVPMPFRKLPVTGTSR
jgi:hypothetical protein